MNKLVKNAKANSQVIKMSHSNKISILCVSLVLLFLVSASFFSSISKVKQTNENIQVKATSEYSQIEESKEENNNGYIVKKYNGQVAIFKEGESDPFEILDINISSLPESDQKALETGISIKDSDKLRKLIEDYDG